MKRFLILYLILHLLFIKADFAQTATNQLFSFGSYGRVGAGFSPAITGNIGRSFNLNGMGSVGGNSGELAVKLFEEITSIQYGISDDRFNWLTSIDKEKVEA